MNSLVVCICKHARTYITFSSYEKGNNEFYLEPAICKYNVTEEETVEEFKSAGKNT